MTKTHKSENGNNADIYILKNSKGIEVKVMNYGGVITSIKTPDKQRNFENIVLGFDSSEKYLSEKYIESNPYFGAIIGRYANRIEAGKFSLNGEEHQLDVNNDGNHLHGGEKGFDKVFWEVESVNNTTVSLSYLSKDGEMGYPGNLKVRVKYTLTEGNELVIEYFAKTNKATPVNLTHHDYFNLSGDHESKIHDHKLRINAGRYTPVNDNWIPTGELLPVEGTPLDFTESRTVGERISDLKNGYDHNFVIDDWDGTLKPVAVLEHPKSGRKMEVCSTEPGMQFYTGNFLDGSLQNEKGQEFDKNCALCLETQHFPNSPNTDHFPDTILNPDEEYGSKTVYRFSVVS